MSLRGDKETRPKGAEGKDGKSTLVLIAKVMEGSTPKAGVAVTFGVEAIANSGGHDHHDASRPKGLVNGALTASGVTDGNGEIKVTFQASKVAGKHVVAAVCSSCSNSSVTKNVEVKVPDLVSLPEDSATPPRYKLIGNTGSVGSKHLGNHYFSTESLEVFNNMLTLFAKHKWGQVGVNDASLIWGGKFDLGLRWGAVSASGKEESHQGHRTGDEVDISFGNPTSISADKRRKVYDELDESEDVYMPEVLWHEFDNPATGSKAHFHLYLLSQKPSSITKY